MKKHLPKLIAVHIYLIIGFFPILDGLAREPNFPVRPITMICGWGAGGMMDLSIRTLSKAAEKELGQPIIVENKTGAGGVIAQSYVCKSKPDGYTLGVTVTSTYILQPHIRKVSYDPLIDVTDVMAYARYVTGFCVRADAPWKSLEDVISFSRKNPSKFNFAHGGVGTTQHISMEWIALKEGIKWTQVPFKSGPEAVMAVLGGHTYSVTQGPADVLPYIKTGELKMLLALNENRWPEAPEVPTIFEKYKFCIPSYLGIYGPKEMPEAQRQKLETIFRNAMKDRSFIDTLNQGQIEIAYLGGKDYATKWKSRYQEMGKLLNSIGLVEK
jgi:tripartite-type tricarboxylate transporter receptor subunit TctC